MLKNGRPYTDENGWIDDALMDNHPHKEEVMKWIVANILPRKTMYGKCSSYSLKHILQHDTQIYLTNNEFKDAMMQAGYNPVDSCELNWHYCISAKSPCFKRKS